MKKTIGLFLLLLILAACGGQAAPEATAVPTQAAAPTSAPEATAVPTQAAAPTAEPTPTTSYIDSLAHTADPALVDIAWRWVQREDADGAVTVEVPDPENYTIEFLEDGTFSAQLDCNSGNGRYATTPPASIFMELGPVNMAECSGQSLAVAMANLFGPAQNYRIEDDGQTLVFSWAADGGTDTFRHPDAPAQAAESGELTGTTWFWTGLLTPVEETTVNDPSRYTVLFNEDGTAQIVADCNNIIAAYAVDGSSLSITPGPSTLVACPEDSQGDVFLNSVQSAAIFFFEEGDLLIDLLADAGTMRFSAAAPAVPTPAATAEGAAEATAAPAVDGAAATVTAADGIFVRSGPGTEFPDIGVAATNEVLPITGRSADGGWWAVEVPLTWSADQQGWVSAQFVEATGAEGVPVVEGPGAVPAPTAVATVDPNAPTPAATATPAAAPSSTPANDTSGGATGILFRVVSFGTPGGEQSLIEGSNITATFSNTDVVGTAGCNDYTARLNPVNDYFTIGPVAVTGNTCTEPDGVMEQEQRFLAALAGTNGYDWATQLVNGSTIITAGVLRYTLADGSSGVINLVAQ